MAEVEGRGGVRRAVQAFQNYNFRVYWTSQLVSQTGTWIQATAQAWLVLQISHSALAVGGVIALQSLPILCGAMFASVIVDRLPKHKLMLITQSLALVQATVLAVLTVTGHIQLWEVDVLALTLGCINAFDNPTRLSFVMELVGREHVVNAVGLNSATLNGSRLIGPAIAGVLIAVIGVGDCFVVNAVSYVAVLIGLALMRPGEFQSRPAARTSGSGMFADLGEGLRFVFTEPKLVTVIIVLFAIGCFGFNFNTFVPLFATQALNLGSDGYGLLMSAVGFGALGASVVMAGALRPSQKRMYVTAIGFSVALIGVAAAPVFGVAEVLMAVMSFCGFMFTTNCNTTLQLSAPDHLRGRVMGLYSTLMAGTTPIGAILTGVLTTAFGIRVTLVIFGLICGLGAALSLAYRARITEAPPGSGAGVQLVAG